MISWQIAHNRVVKEMIEDDIEIALTTSAMSQAETVVKHQARVELLRFMLSDSFQEKVKERSVKDR